MVITIWSVGEEAMHVAANNITIGCIYITFASNGINVGIDIACSRRLKSKLRYAFFRIRMQNLAYGINDTVLKRINIQCNIF